MWRSDQWKDYELIDCGRGEKLERWGDQLLVRPDPQAIWNTPRTHRGWKQNAGRYARSSSGGGQWQNKSMPERWTVSYGSLTFNIKPMNFKHTGLFPEQAANWDFAQEQIRRAGRPISVLNLFAYTGGATVACAAAGASVCHVDAARGMVSWARENARSSHLEDAPIRWIVDDCAKFVEREIRRGRRYDAIIMDPPSYGRGPSGEVWRLEENLYPFVELVSGVLSLHRPQLLHHRAGPLRAHLYPRNSDLQTVRRPHCQRRAGPPRHSERAGPPLRRDRTLDLIQLGMRN